MAKTPISKLFNSGEKSRTFFITCISGRLLTAEESLSRQESCQGYAKLSATFDRQTKKYSAFNGNIKG